MKFLDVKETCKVLLISVSGLRLASPTSNNDVVCHFLQHQFFMHFHRLLVCMIMIEFNKPLEPTIQKPYMKLFIQ
jgi:hypothetical protein